MNKTMNTQERKNRIIARGEHSNHSHVLVGGEVERNKDGEIILTVGKEGAVLRHLLESNWMEGQEVWTKEHDDIPLKEGAYKYVAQEEFDPFEKIVRRVVD